MFLLSKFKNLTCRTSQPVTFEWLSIIGSTVNKSVPTLDDNFMAYKKEFQLKKQ